MKKLLLLFILAIPCLFNSFSQSEKTSIAIFPFSATAAANKGYATIIQQQVVEILRKKSGIQLIDRSNDSLQVKELDLSMREVSVDAKGPAEQGKLLVGAQMIVGTLSSVNVEETRQTNTGGKSLTSISYTATLTFGLQLSDVETGKVIDSRVFGATQSGGGGGLLSTIGLGAFSSSADTKEEAISSAIKSTRGQIIKWINGLYPPEINIFRIEERDKKGKPQKVLVTGVDESFGKGSQFYVHEIEMLDTGNGKKLRRLKKIARLRISELQGEVTVCTVSDGEDVLEEKMNNKVPMVFTAK